MSGPLATDAAPRTVWFPFHGATLGGSHLATLMLVEHLPPRYRPIIVVHERGQVTAHLETRGIQYRFIPLPRAPDVDLGRWPLLLQIGAATPYLAYLLRRHRVALVHCNDGQTNVMWGPAARLAGLPMVWHQHSHYVQSRFANAFVRCASRVLGVSDFSVANLPAELRARTAIVRNPFVTASRPPNRIEAGRALRAEFGLPEGARVLLYLGNFSQRKRPEEFVSIVAAVRRMAPEMQVYGLMLGDAREPMRSQVIRRIEAEGVSNQLILAGFRYPAEPVVAGCDLLVAAAINEAFGRTLVEAMLVGTPVVAAASGGHREILSDRDAGVLVEPDDIEGFAKVISTLLRSEAERKRLAELGASVARATYAMSAHVAAICGIYDELTRR